MADGRPGAGPDVLLAVRDVEKDYFGIRPLRVRALEVRAGDAIAILGLDRAAAEAFVNLVTAATLPDSGEILSLGHPTTAIADSEAWMRLLDHFGILSERALLLDEMTAEQNLAMPFSLELFDIPPDVRVRVDRLAAEVGLTPDLLATPAATLPSLMRARLRLARALALDPRVLLAEHPNALIEPAEVAAFADDFARVRAARGITSVVLTADPTFARTVASHTLTHNPATGELRASAGWRRWFT